MAEKAKGIARRSVRVSEPGPDIGEYVARLKTGRPDVYRFAALVGLRVKNRAELLERLEKGLSYRALVRFQQNAGMPMSEVADVVRITPRTLTRRKEEGRLQPDESDRLLRASRLFALALELFEGDAKAARTWLMSPQLGLGGARPFDCVKTDIGAKEVEDFIGRIEHGLPA
jgi:putative toxin-antitoxin system antitoxin component (TIGR02293 family)